MVVFDRPVGAEPDTKEIEYIAALHQSGSRGVRSDGSIQDVDIKIYLRSRFGIEVTIDQVRNTIMKGMGGGTEDDDDDDDDDKDKDKDAPNNENADDKKNQGDAKGDDEADNDDDVSKVEAVLDLMELVAILMIPLLIKAAIVEGPGHQGIVSSSPPPDENDNDGNGGQTKLHPLLPDGVLPPPDGLLRDVADMLTHDATGDKEPKPLTADLIRNIFLMYGEKSLADDKTLIDEMLIAATATSGTPAANGSSRGPDEAEEAPILFDVHSFARALTADVQLYDIENETRQSSIIQDIFDQNRVEEMKYKLLLSNSSHHQQQKKSKQQQQHQQTSGQEMTLQEGQAGTTEKEDEETSNAVVDIKDIRRIFTAPAIDITAGTYRSKALIICLWGCTMFVLFLTVIQTNQSASGCSELYVEGGTYGQNAAGVTCDVILSILNWLIRFFVFCAIGVIIMGLGSLGNYVGNQRRWYLPLIAMFVTTFVAYYHVIADEEEDKQYAFLEFMKVMGTILGTTVIYLHGTHIVTMCFGRNRLGKYRWLNYVGFGALKQELQIKKSAAFKLNCLATNARDIHYAETATDVFKTYFGHGLSSYVLHGKTYVKEGGKVWFWRKLWDQSLFSEEGLWYSARLVAANISQLFMCLFILMLGTYYMKQIIENYGEEKAESQLQSVLGIVFDNFVNEDKIIETSLAVTNQVYAYVEALNSTGIISIACSQLYDTSTDAICDIDFYGYYDCSNVQSTEALCALMQNPDLGVDDPGLQIALLNVTGFKFEDAVGHIEGNLASAISSATESLYPEEMWMLTVPFGIGIAVAVMNAFLLFLSYLPSVTATIIELRTGTIPSLKDKSFQKYRVAPDTVTLLTGSLFWGSLVSSVLFGLIVAFIVFILLWQGSRVLVQKLITILIGLAIIIAIRLSVIACCKAAFFNGLYRTRPAGANIAFMALEWANYIFTTAFILVRMFKLVLTAASQIGKIDRPFLAKGVGNLGPLELDPFPTIHTRDLVAHEAHRHPYIEVLGLLYLMKLRYADAFCTRSGSAWRLLFVYALLPWLHQYRIHEDALAKYEKGTDCDGKKDFADALGGVPPVSFSNSGLVNLPSHRSSNDLPVPRHLASLHESFSSDSSASDYETADPSDKIQRLKEKNRRMKARLLRMQAKFDEMIKEN